MKKIFLVPFLLLCSTGLFAQQGRVGINTTTPATTLDINGVKAAGTGLTPAIEPTGLQAPRLTRAELTSKGNALYTAAQNGAIVYITDISAGDALSQRVNITTTGYYYFDGVANVWQKMVTKDPFFQVSPTSTDNIVYTNSSNFGKRFLVNSNSPSYTPTNGLESKMMFIPNKLGAFRAGLLLESPAVDPTPALTGVEWNDANVGAASAAFGISNKALGSASFSAGTGNNVEGNGGFAIGYFNTASKQYSMGLGYLNNITGSFAFGFGKELQVKSANEIVLGYNNDVSNYTPSESGTNTATAPTWQATDRLFSIGNGSSVSSKSNALLMLKNGNTALGNVSPTQKLDIDGNGRIRALPDADTFTYPYQVVAKADGTLGRELDLTGTVKFATGAFETLDLTNVTRNNLKDIYFFSHGADITLPKASAALNGIELTFFISGGNPDSFTTSGGLSQNFIVKMPASDASSNAILFNPGSTAPYANLISAWSSTQINFVNSGNRVLRGLNFKLVSNGAGIYRWMFWASGT